MHLWWNWHTLAYNSILLIDSDPPSSSVEPFVWTFQKREFGNLADDWVDAPPISRDCLNGVGAASLSVLITSHPYLVGQWQGFPTIYSNRDFLGAGETEKFRFGFQRNAVNTVDGNGDPVAPILTVENRGWDLQIVRGLGNATLVGFPPDVSSYDALGVPYNTGTHVVPAPHGDITLYCVSLSDNLLVDNIATDFYTYT